MTFLSILHELYFDGLAVRKTDPGGEIRKAVEKPFGSLDKWAADFAASAKAAAGWAVLVVHPVNGRLYNVVSDEHAPGPLWMAVRLVVIGTCEHAFYADYQSKRAEYVEKFLGSADWAEAERRYRSVVKGLTWVDGVTARPCPPARQVSPGSGWTCLP